LAGGNVAWGFFISDRSTATGAHSHDRDAKRIDGIAIAIFDSGRLLPETVALLALSACLLVIVPWVDPPRVEVGLACRRRFRIESLTHEVTTTPEGMENIQLKDARGSLQSHPTERSWWPAPHFF